MALAYMKENRNVADEPTQQPPAPEQDTASEPDAPQHDEGTRDAEAPAENYEQRYNDLRPEFDRKSQQLARLERDPNYIYEFIAEHHPDLVQADDEGDVPEVPEDENLDPVEALKADFEQFRTEQETEAQRREWEGFVEQVSDHVDELTDGLGLTDRQRQAILNEALSSESPSPENTQQIVDGWKQDLQSVAEKRLNEWREGKKVDGPGSGAAAVEKIDKGDSKQRVKYINDRMAELGSPQ